MTYITQKMDLVMIGFHIEYPETEKYTSPIPQHLFAHKFVHQEEGMGVYKKWKSVIEYYQWYWSVISQKRNAEARCSFLYLHPEKIC